MDKLTPVYNGGRLAAISALIDANNGTSRFHPCPCCQVQTMHAERIVPDTSDTVAVCTECGQGSIVDYEFPLIEKVKEWRPYFAFEPNLPCPFAWVGWWLITWQRDEDSWLGFSDISISFMPD